MIFPFALTARCSLTPYTQPLVPQPHAAKPRLVQCCRALGVAGLQRGGVRTGGIGAPALSADAEEEQQHREHPQEARTAAQTDPSVVEDLQGPAARGVKQNQDGHHLNVRHQTSYAARASAAQLEAMRLQAESKSLENSPSM